MRLSAHGAPARKARCAYEICVRANVDLSRHFNLIWGVQSCAKKYFAMPVGQIISTSSRRSVPEKRDASRSSRVLGAECDGRGTSTDERCCARTAKSCGPDTPRQVSSWRRCFASRRRRRQQSLVSGESAKQTVKTIAQGMPVIRLSPVVTTARVLFLIAREAVGGG